MGEITDLICAGKPLTKELADYGHIFGEIVELAGGKCDKASVQAAVRRELGSVCARILENTAVFKDPATTAEFLRNAL